MRPAPGGPLWTRDDVDALDASTTGRSERAHVKMVAAHVQRFARAEWGPALWTLGSTAALYAASAAAWWRLVEHPALDAGPARALAAATWLLLRVGVLSRLFILVHDLGHFALCPSASANRAIGLVAGALMFTPLDHWRATHNLHHRVAGSSEFADPSRTVRVTTQAYARWPVCARAGYRVGRDPLVFFALAPAAVLLVAYRFARVRGQWLFGFLQPLLVTLAKGAELAAWAHWHGTARFVAWDLLAAALSASVGFVLVHLQHEVNVPYLEPSSTFSREDAALRGSTLLRVPWWARWATLGLEYHHVHHFNTRVPCYNLQACHDSAPPGAWRDVVVVGPRKALRSLTFTLFNAATRRYEAFWPTEPIARALLGDD
jgi:omega-6 fatty acid desaturase (delta-12 desaturase)